MVSTSQPLSTLTSELNSNSKTNGIDTERVVL